MRLTATLVLLAGLCALASDARADEWSFDSYLKRHNQSDWNDLGVGTMVHRKTVNEVSMPQMPEPQRQEMEEKKTLVKVTEDEFVIKVERKMMGQWQTSETSEPKSKNWEVKVEDVGTETVTVGSTDYPCTMKKVTWTDGDEVKEETTMSVHPDKGILKMRASREGNTFEAVVTNLKASWQVGDVTIEGRELEMNMQTPMGPMTGKMGVCPKVPDGMVSQKFQGGQGPMKMDVVTELVAFVKK